jgi:hypothetical protein
MKNSGRFVENLSELKGAEVVDDEKHAENKSEIPYSINDERLLPGLRGRVLFEPEPDKEIGTEPHTLPADEEQKIAVAEHQQEHGEHEQIQEEEIAGESIVIVHVSRAVDVDEETNTGDDQDHHRGQGIEQEPERNLEASRLYP